MYWGSLKSNQPLERKNRFQIKKIIRFGSDTKPQVKFGFVGCTGF